MLDTRTQARLTRNMQDAAVGYANASTAAMTLFAQQALDFWLAPWSRQEPQRHRDHLSWFNPEGRAPHGSAFADRNPWLMFNPWMRASPVPVQPPDTAVQLIAMTWAFAPFALWWNSLRGPTFAWPMAYSMMAQGVPDSVAWPAAEANAAAMDAATTLTDHAQQTFASYQSAGGFAMAHILPSKEMALALSAWMVPTSVFLHTMASQPAFT